jgi:hypothetical protein
MRTRVLGVRTLALLKRAQDAQRHHHLVFSFRATPTPDVCTALRALTRLGVIAHTRGRPARTRPGSEAPRSIISCTLRYWEGRPLVTVVTTPVRACSYRALTRRTKEGSGVGLLFWAQGRLMTGRECLQRRIGGLLLATLCA